LLLQKAHPQFRQHTLLSTGLLFVPSNSNKQQSTVKLLLLTVRVTFGNHLKMYVFTLIRRTGLQSMSSKHEYMLWLVPHYGTFIWLLWW